MLLNAKVSQLIISDHTVTVSVISEDILDHVIKFMFVFLQQINQSVGNLSFVKLFVSVSVKWSQSIVHSLSHLHGEFKVGEFEFSVSKNLLLLDWLDDWFEFDQETVKSGVDIIIGDDPKFIAKVFQHG